MYLNLRPSNAQLAKGVIAFLENYDTAHTFTVITQNELMDDGFLDELTKLIKAHKWTIENTLFLSGNTDTNEDIADKLTTLRENKARINIVHCTNVLVRRVFKQASKSYIIIIIIIIIIIKFQFYFRFLTLFLEVFIQDLGRGKVMIICIICIYIFATSFWWYFFLVTLTNLS